MKEEGEIIADRTDLKIKRILGIIQYILKWIERWISGKNYKYQNGQK